ncbi:MAG: amidohydrolase family protein [Actinobacteria bacterium]|nr:amidohydrolase family protein [Actinomycetota bacterium]
MKRRLPLSHGNDRAGSMHSDASFSGPHELVIDSVEIVDGRGGPSWPGAITVRDGRISEVIRGGTDYHRGRRVLNGEGMVAAPGFIDAHQHTDVNLLVDRQHAATLSQGVTTHVIGQDGLSYAPCDRADLDSYKKYVAPINGTPLSWDWSSVADFRRQFDGTVAVNTAYQVPHGTVRFQVSGMSNAQLVGKALHQACHLLEEAFDQGAVGFSTGLSYFPGSFAHTEEIVALCKVAERRGRPYVTHVRSVFPHGYIDPMEEAIEIARRTGVKLHISHYRTTATTVGRPDEVMAKLDEAYAQGVDITFDMYPYLYGSGPLHIGLPPWAFEDGLQKTLTRLADPRLRDALITGIRQNTVKLEGRFTHVPSHPEYEGRALDEVAGQHGQGVADFVCDLLLEEQLDVTFHQGTPDLLDDQEKNRRFERDCLELLDRPFAMVGSDGIYLGKYPHERGYGTFPRLIRLAREHGFPISKLVNRMTNVPAQRFALADRGVIATGAAADLVVFDPAATRELATVDRPRELPEGISIVVVNGQLALDRGRPTGLMAGRALS